MTNKKRNIIASSIVTLIIIFIYVPIRTGLMEQQYIKSITASAEKIVISLSSFEKEKKLQNKDLTKFYSIIKEKYPVALIAVADKKNKILKAGKDDKAIKSNTAFDSIIDSFVTDEFKIFKNNDFLIRYYEQDRFYIFPRNITGGKLLILFPYKLGMKLIIQLILEIFLIAVFSIIITAMVFIKINKKKSKQLNDKKNIFSKTERKPGKQKKQENVIIKAKEKSEPEKADGIRPNLDALSGFVYEAFEYISREYNSDSVSLYLLDEANSKLNKTFELNGNVLIKIDNAELNVINLNRELMDELKNSSIIMQGKGRKVTIPVLFKNVLFGIISITRDTEFRGPEINDIKSRIKILAKPLGEQILLSEILSR
ncbi:MAG: hypothetical protein V1874_15860 [Spirochaetota bacterium]